MKAQKYRSVFLVNSFPFLFSSRGYMFAGLEFGAECYCGHKIQAPNASESECNMDCKGEKSNLCGGANRLSIYRLELSQESARRCESDALQQEKNPPPGFIGTTCCSTQGYSKHKRVLSNLKFLSIISRKSWSQKF